jgi:predicted  nucleic acid-binding Zn-ribbon protein
MEAQELESLRTKLADAELALEEAKQSQAQSRDRLDRLEAQLATAQGAAFASERAAEQLRMAQERMREALSPMDDEDAGEASSA